MGESEFGAKVSISSDRPTPNPSRKREGDWDAQAPNGISDSRALNGRGAESAQWAIGMTPSIRSATPADLPLIGALIRELAEYEKLAHDVRFDEAELGEHLFGPRPYAEVIIGEVDGAAQGFALFFHNFSTFEGKPGIYLEDLYVRPEARGGGLGRALLTHLAGLALARGCARLEWSVLDWNEPALGFYRRLGARAMDEWTVMRLDGDALERMAR